ncbi:hypothetical protein JHK85_008071 [Glycine max]|nr:hypothetical protein JHK85_008071 [Glycine max]
MRNRIAGIKSNISHLSMVKDFRVKNCTTHSAGKFLRGCLNKWKKMGSRVIHCAAYSYCCEWEQWSSMHEDEGDSIPNDVPKGHLVVYVGEHHKRYVIKITLLNHPLFKTLLDQAKDEYDFIADSKLYIPCTEHLFLTVLRRASTTTPHNE